MHLLIHDTWSLSKLSSLCFYCGKNVLVEGLRCDAIWVSIWWMLILLRENSSNFAMHFSTLTPFDQCRNSLLLCVFLAPEVFGLWYVGTMWMWIGRISVGVVFLSSHGLLLGISPRSEKKNNLVFSLDYILKILILLISPTYLFSCFLFSCRAGPLFWLVPFI